MPTYRLHDTTGGDLGTVEYPAPERRAGDVIVLDDGREALVTAPCRDGRPRSLRGAAGGCDPPTPLTSDGAIA